VNGQDLQWSDLDIGVELGDGGQGKVHSVGSDGARVVKAYHDQVTDQFDAAALTRLIGMTDVLSHQGRPVHEWAAWPLARVAVNGRVVGFVMPRVPEDFVIHIGGKKRLASLSYLACEPAPMWGPVSLPDDVERMAILSHLAGVMQTLHDRGLVIGDLSFGNVLWSDSPPGVMLIDCDGVHPEGGPSAMPQADTIDWADPHGEPGAPDRDTDRYKLSLAIVRVLSRHLSITPSGAEDVPLRIPAERETTIRALIQRAAGPRGSRPEAREWRAALSTRETVAVTPPQPRTSSLPPKPDLLHGGSRTRQYRQVVPPGDADVP
jgi:DNA-binding helix-hairpin-helix protein with protein kinase domain